MTATEQITTTPTAKPLVMPVIRLSDDHWYIDVSVVQPARLLEGPYLNRDEAVRTREHLKRMWKQERKLKAEEEPR